LVVKLDCVVINVEASVIIKVMMTVMEMEIMDMGESLQRQLNQLERRIQSKHWMRLFRISL